jgi:nitroreductase
MNLMLAAWEAGLGSCWIGLAITLLNQPEVKEELGVPANYEAIAPILLGHPAEEGRPMQRKPPEVLFWK